MQNNLQGIEYLKAMASRAVTTNSKKTGKAMKSHVLASLASADANLPAPKKQAPARNSKSVLTKTNFHMFV
jgi:hypothetical protein